ncbi:hypothetical protein AALB39_05900 [Lachnospiraceae bacterium 54-53]
MDQVRIMGAFAKRYGGNFLPYLFFAVIFRYNDYREINSGCVYGTTNEKQEAHPMTELLRPWTALPVFHYKF